MAFDFDQGSSGSQGPWIGWAARSSHDGSIPAKSFFMRDGDGKSPFAGFTNGVVMDIDTMKTGWCYSSGVAGQAPDWKWNATVSKFNDKPGDDYKRGFQIVCAIGGGETATWEQSGAGAWNAFVNLVPHLQGQTDGKLPLVRMTGVKDEKFARGSTSTPLLEVVKWVDRPDCLKEGAGNIDTDSAPDAPTAPAAPVPADAEF